MFSQDLRYTKFTDCASCAEYRKQIFKYRSYPKGIILPQERCMQNTLYFLLKGSVLVNSEEHPNTIFSEGQFILQPIGSKVEFKVLEACECILYLFERPINVCSERFNKGASIAETARTESVVLDMCPPLRFFVEGMRMYLNDELLCAGFLQAKRTELVYLLNCYYTLKRPGCILFPDLPVQQKFPLLRHAELYEGKRCGSLRPDGRLQYTYFPPSV